MNTYKYISNILGINVILFLIIFLCAFCLIKISGIYVPYISNIIDIPDVPTLGFFEGFKTGIVPRTSCPNMLIKKDGKIYLYNTRKAPVPGVNPIVFNNLEEYAEFNDWQHANEIHCPVLQLEKTYDIQGNENYKLQPDILNVQGGIPPMRLYGLDGGSGGGAGSSNFSLLTDAGRNDPSYNWNSYPAYDSHGQDIGTTTPQDAMDTASQMNPLYPSPNPMDPNWGGAEFTQTLVDKGVYKGNEVQIYVP